MSQNKQDWDVRLPVYTANFMFNTACRCLPSLFSPTGDCVGVWAVEAEEEAVPRGDLSLVRLQELQQVERQTLFRIDWKQQCKDGLFLQIIVNYYKTQKGYFWN